MADAAGGGNCIIEAFGTFGAVCFSFGFSEIVKRNAVFFR